MDNGYLSRHVRFNIPKEVLDIIVALRKSGFQAHIVGGCVRDIARFGFLS
jgi:tRNA nucleotidyltransferase/poly(A) polymerase